MFVQALLGVSGDSRSRCDGFDAAVVAATAERTVLIESDMADLAGSEGCAVVDLAVNDDPAANTGGNGHVEHVL